MMPAFGLLLLIGPIFGGAGLLVRSGSQPYDDGVLTTGEVIDYEVTRNDGARTFSEVVRFMTEDGDVVEFTGSVSTSNPNDIGSEVRVSYRPSEPHKARNLDDGGAVLAWIFIGLGALLTVITVLALLTMLGTRIRRRRAPVAAIPRDLLAPGPLAASDDWEARTWDEVPNAGPGEDDPIGDTDFITDEDRGF